VATLKQSIRQFKGYFLQSSISPQYLALLKQHQLASFEQLWAYQGDWFELPNRERGGWSGVNFIELVDTLGKKQGFYLKRQQGHMRRTCWHPIAGEPTFVREFEMIRHLNQHDVVTPEVVYFSAQGNQALLLTRALEGFVSLDSLQANTHLGFAQANVLIRELAGAVRRMHQAHVQHRSLYDKHLFINDNTEVALIDFEKSRTTSLIAYLKYADLITLNYRTRYVSRTQKLRFFKHYVEIEHLTPWYKLLCRYIHHKSQSKRNK
jgi:serine/threonine protein kinase